MNITPASPGCLAGIRVLDLTQFEAGTSCTEALAWMGADIAKIENPKGGEAGRTGFGDAYYFMMYNANKRSITVNLKLDRGLALVKEMVKKADVFTENFAPGAVERLGLGYDVVSAINPAIIYAQVKGFGDGSPHEKGLAFDPIAQAAGGAMSVTGERDGRPIRSAIRALGCCWRSASSVRCSTVRAPAKVAGCKSLCKIPSCTTAAVCSSRRHAPVPPHRGVAPAITHRAASIRASLAAPTITSTC